MTTEKRQTVYQERGRGAIAETISPERSLLPVSLVALISAIGVLMVAVAYTGGRLESANASWAGRLYWPGQLLILGPIAIRIISRKALSSRETVTLIITLTVAEYLVKICYSPMAFTYADELMHWRSATNILQTGKLFQVNYMLPISSYYPGLEEVTSALVSVTGLSLFDAGLIVAGAAHLLFVCVLFAIIRYIIGSYRIAGVAVLLYASESLFQSFDSMFVYQSLALPFLGLTVLAICQLSVPAATGRTGRSGWVVTAGITILAAVVTHHVTSLMLVGTLGVIAIGASLAHDYALARRAAIATVAAATALVCWVAFFAPSTVSYLQPTAEQVLQAFRSIIAQHPSPNPASSVGTDPLKDKLVAGVAALLMSVLVPIGWWQVWRRYRHNAWVVALAVGSLGWYVVVTARLFVADGPELAGRASTFIFVPASFMVTFALLHLAQKCFRWPVVGAYPRRREPFVVGAMVVVALVLVINGLINGWPPYWERLPGPYQVAGAERSIGPDQVASAEWALAKLGPGNTFASDEGDTPVLGTYGDQNTVRIDNLLYIAPKFTEPAAQLVQAASISYVLVDWRLSEMLPASGQYFPIDPNANTYTHPLSAADLAKFNYIPGVARIYDAGNIVIYDLNGSAYYGS